jgi:hypothetical protein
MNIITRLIAAKLNANKLEHKCSIVTHRAITITTIAVIIHRTTVSGQTLIVCTGLLLGGGAPGARRMRVLQSLQYHLPLGDDVSPTHSK